MLYLIVHNVGVYFRPQLALLCREAGRMLIFTPSDFIFYDRMLWPYPVMV